MMLNYGWNFARHGQILISHCPMTGCYLQSVQVHYICVAAEFNVTLNRFKALTPGLGGGVLERDILGGFQLVSLVFEL